MHQHFRILGIILLIFGIIGVMEAIAASVFIGFMALGTSEVVVNAIPKTIHVERNYNSFEIYLFLAAVIIYIIVSALYIFAGAGLLRRRSWARGMSIIVSVFSLLNVPLGTAIGVYGLWLMYSADGLKAWNEYLNGVDIQAEAS